MNVPNHQPLNQSIRNPIILKSNSAHLSLMTLALILIQPFMSIILYDLTNMEIDKIPLPHS